MIKRFCDQCGKESDEKGTCWDNFVRHVVVTQEWENIRFEKHDTVLFRGDLCGACSDKMQWLKAKTL